MIQNSAMLVELNIGTWTGRKMDKKVSDEIDASKNTRAKGGNYHKKLLAGTQTLEDLQKLVSSVRTWHYEQTLPWSDGGSRLLPMKNFFDYKTKLTELELQFSNGVRDFLSEYDTSVTAAAFQLGELFNKEDYPESDKLADKFKFNYVFMPVPTAGDFRIDVNDIYQEELRQQYDNFYTTKLNDAMQEAWDRLHGCLSRISEKLGGDDKQIFRDSLVTNAEDICELLTKLNVMNDPKLETARKMLESALIGVTPKGLRQEEDTRAHVKAKVDEILGMFN